MKKLFIILIVLNSCTKSAESKTDLFQKKDWFLYKEITPTETVNYSRQYWFRAQGGQFRDYDRYDGYYRFSKDTFIVTFPGYGINNYIIESVTPDHLIMTQTEGKGVVYRKLFFKK
jgi:hypothetical protein